MPKNQTTPSTSTPKKSAKREPVFEHGARRFDAIYDTDTEDLAHMKQQKMPRMSFAIQRNEAPAPNVPSTSSTSAAPNNGFKAPLPPSSQKGSSPGNNVGGSAPGPSNDGNSTRTRRHLNPELSTPKSNGFPSTRQTRRSNGAPPTNLPSTSSSSAAPVNDHAQDCQPGPSPYSNPTKNNGVNGDCAIRNGKRLSQEPAISSSTSKRSRKNNNTSSSPQPSSSGAAKRPRNGTHSPSIPSTSASKSDALAEDNERHGAAKIPEYRERRGRKSGSSLPNSPMETDGTAAATSDPDSGISSGSSRESTGPAIFKAPLMRPPRKTMTISREPSVAPSICSREGSVFSVASSSWNQEPQTNRIVWLSLLDELRRDPSDAEKARIVSEVEKMRRKFTATEKKEFDLATEYFEYQKHRRANSVSIMAPIRSRQPSVAPDDDEDPFRGQQWRGAREESSRRSSPVVEEEEDEEEQNGGDMDDVGGQMDDQEQEQQNQDGRDEDKKKPEKTYLPIPIELVIMNKKGKDVPMTEVQQRERFTNFYINGDKKLFHIGTDRKHCDLSLDTKNPRATNFGEKKNREFVEKHATKPDGPNTEVYESTLRPDADRVQILRIENDTIIKQNVNIFTAKQIPKAKECSPENQYGNLRDKKMWTTPVVSKMKESLEKMDKSLMRKLRKRMEKELAEEGEEPTEAKIIEEQFFEILKVAYIRPIWQQFRGHIPMEFALQNLMGNGYDFGKSLDKIDGYLNILPQQPPNLCSSQAKGMHEWLYYCVAFKGDKRKERIPATLNTRSLLHLKATRNFFPFEMHNMCFQFHRYYQYQNRFGVPCNCKEWLCESIPFEPRYACRNCTKNGKVDHDYMKKLCLICQAYKKWFKKDRPAKEVNFTSVEKQMMKDWITMDAERREQMTREEFEKEHKKALEQKWRNGIMEAEEELMLNIDEVSSTKKSQFKTEEERNEFICKELQPFEMPHFTKCNCIASGRFPNGSRGVIFKEKDRKEFASALRETNSVKEAARLMGWSMDDVWLFLHRFGREKPMWKSFKPEELDQIFRGMNRLSTHLPPILPVPIRNQRVWPCKECIN